MKLIMLGARLLLGLSAIFIAACEYKERVAPEKNPQVAGLENPREPGDFLEKNVALRRSERLSDVSYQFFLDLPAENEPFAGITTITFSLADTNSPLTLDFVDGEVISIVLNGEGIEPAYNGYFITLPTEKLSAGRQTVVVEYTHPYRRDGRGLHWFKDPVDGETYLYTQFEIADFNKVFPGFDQPDIKATYQLQVEVPGNWQVISAKRESDIEAVEDDRKRWTFPETKKFSTYMFPLHAGPYQMWEQDFRIPLRLFARASYAQNVEVEQWFEYTRQGFDFFENYFNHPYPFDKYDQILVPEFVFSAMENVGSVTFRENQQPVGRNQTDNESMRFAVIVMHEMAHHWFGNLVTMRWWDDLWLNESFADLMGWYATANATKYSAAMEGFALNRKPWGYEEDRAVTTHPIVQNVNNTDAAFNSIDGITYAKGASSLVQLKHVLGDVVFQQGITNYFSVYGWRNTELNDFIGMLAETSGRDLSIWKHLWLETAGVNTLQAEFSCINGKLDMLSIEQKPANFSAALRQHRFDILLLDDANNETLIEVAVGMTPHTQLPVPEDNPCPVFVLPNVSEFTFASIELDALSRDYLRDRFGEITNPVQRSLIWRSLWESAIDGKVPATEVLDLAINHLADEGDPSSLFTQIEYLLNVYSYLAIRPAEAGTDGSAGEYYRQQFEAQAWARYQQTQGSAQQAWLDLWLAMLQSPSSIQNALALLDDGKLADDDRWLVVNALIREAIPQGRAWADQLRAQDNSAATQLNYWIALSQEPTTAAKIRWIKEVGNSQSDYAFTQLRAIFEKLFPVQHYQLQLEMQEELVNSIPRLIAQTTSPLLTTYVANLLALRCGLEGQQVVTNLLALEGLSEQVIKALKKHAQAEERCAAAQRQLDGTGEYF